MCLNNNVMGGGVNMTSFASFSPFLNWRFMSFLFALSHILAVQLVLVRDKQNPNGIKLLGRFAIPPPRLPAVFHPWPYAASLCSHERQIIPNPHRHKPLAKPLWRRSPPLFLKYSVSFHMRGIRRSVGTAHMQEWSSATRLTSCVCLHVFLDSMLLVANYLRFNCFSAKQTQSDIPFNL